MGYLIMIGQLMLSLSILVILHELGHFLPAKWFKTRVEKFYLFFDPYFSIFKQKIGETEYGIGWLPLGGYVKISGMIDESMDEEQMAGPPQPWEFRSKPAWQRLIIMLGGVIVNFVLGFFLFGMLLWSFGETTIPNKSLQYGLAPDCVGEKLGFQEGDQILKVGGEEFIEFNQGHIKQAIAIDNARSIQVRRENGQIEDIRISNEEAKTLASHAMKNMALVQPRMPFIINKLEVGLPAKEAGLLEKDRIIAVNGVPTPFYHQFTKEIKDKKNTQVQLGVIRANDTLNIALTTTDAAKIGVQALPPTHFFDVKTKEYTLGEAMPEGVSQGVSFLGSQIKAFGQMFKGKIKASESLGGFGSIANLFPKYWDWERFIRMTAILSLILGFMNLLPIPGLDGGHVVFLLFEMITGRKIGDDFMKYATMVGFAILIFLMLFANGMDVFRAVGEVIDPCTLL